MFMQEDFLVWVISSFGSSMSPSKKLTVSLLMFEYSEESNEDEVNIDWISPSKKN